MLFNSHLFLFLFLPTVLLLYWRAPAGDARKWILVLASYVFYGAWSWKFAGLMLATTSVDYFTARWIEDSKYALHRRRWLVVSMVSNLGVLGIFKYYDFFAGSLARLLHVQALPMLHLILPIGISFYTFESMSYTIDVYRGEVKAARRFIDYAHFVTMFPRLVAGPIVRYSQLREQLQNAPPRLTADRAAEAIQFFTIGLAKKTLVADYIWFNVVNPLWHHPGNLNLASAWTAALAYTVQIYMDFSGYSDMAVGLGLLVGFRLPRNFNIPYRAASVSEFWRRWHISLSTWLRDYLYIPLGGNRKGATRTRINLAATMLLGGLWHGASWTFVLWGAYHGAALMVHHTPVFRARKSPRALAVAATFVVVVLGWVLFRAESVHDALHVYQAMAGLHGIGLSWALGNRKLLAALGVGLALCVAGDSYDLPRPRLAVWAVALALLGSFCLLRLETPSAFIYYQF